MTAREGIRHHDASSLLQLEDGWQTLLEFPGCTYTLNSGNDGKASCLCLTVESVDQTTQLLKIIRF